VTPALAEGRRERKKRQTREAILAAARSLFVERGYDGTTLRDIADTADIASSTLFSYFATKDQIFFSDYDEMIDDYACSIEEWSRAVPTIAAVRRWTTERLPLFINSGNEWVLQRARLIAATPALEILRRNRIANVEAALQRAFARDYGESPDALRPRIATQATIAALTALTSYWYENHRSLGASSPAAVADYALSFAEAGVEALRRSPPAGSRGRSR
jgi:AcrR family transcriptional regulator